MKNRWQTSHPATLYCILFLVVVFSSWIAEIYGLKVIMPTNGVECKVQSVLSPEGIRWWLKHSISNFIEFPPFGMSIIALFAFSIAKHSGFIDACFTAGIGGNPNRKRIIVVVIFLGLLSNSIGDGGYLLLLPIVAMLFKRIGLHPLAGIIVAFVAVACGYSANIFLSTLDPLLAHITQEVSIDSVIYRVNSEPLNNYFFMAVSTFVVGFVIYFITVNFLIPSIHYRFGSVVKAKVKKLSRKERRALFISISVFLFYLIFILWLSFSSHGILRSVNGGIMHSPFISGMLFLISVGISLASLCYGYYSGRYHSDVSIIEGFTSQLKEMSSYFIIVFFAAQMFACLSYSNLDKIVLVSSSNWFSSLPLQGVSGLIFFVFFVALVNLLMVSSTFKWSILAYIFIPLFITQGVPPEVVQGAFRIGDSVTNGLTPFLFYMPLVLVYMQSYNREVSYGSLLRYTWRYSLSILIVWTLFFALWYLLKLPMGL